MGQQLQFFVGSYAAKDAEGITLIRLDTATGEMERIAGKTGIANPSFLILNRNRTRLYAVSETDPHPGSVASFAVDPNGGLNLMNEQPVMGTAPCHVTLDQEDRCLIAANYNGGNVVLFPIGPDGTVGPIVDNVRHSGRGPRDDRQEGPHPHSSIIDPSGRFAIVADLGTDKLVHYRIDYSAGRLITECETTASPGAGPRHLAFHPAGRFLYVVNELSSTITVYRYEGGETALEPLQTISTLPESFGGENTCADIHLTSGGRFLYASNRGHDSIAGFRVGVDGLLEPVEITPSGGRTPRNFAVTPDDRYLLTANQQSDCIVSYRINADTGQLLFTGHRLEIAAPVCIAIM
ncbi:lactonase family protein [Paenibacillus sp. sptzw28]|uniref:lactonase family protein n=1 Tax=Paenibacillus sp. sptzw28 TaxID=715179 RepID=UPI001C6EB8D2|nr:lactonase family protein [Paenibacillus sp. sptzw28]QYR21670.1 lactonase family protein [Paenibacillus sp. sptzw28]